MAERLKSTPLVDRIRQHFIFTVQSAMASHPKVAFYPDHVAEVERHAIYLLEQFPEADKETVLLGVWLHDIGNLIGDKKIDHAIRSEQETRRILAEFEVDQLKIDTVAHCVRAHRNKDIVPESLEAKIVTAADSASHLTGNAYLVYAGRNDIPSSLAKMERDYRDIGLIPGFREKFEALYNNWKTLLADFPTYE